MTPACSSPGQYQNGAANSFELLRNSYEDANLKDQMQQQQLVLLQSKAASIRRANKLRSRVFFQGLHSFKPLVTARIPSLPEHVETAHTTTAQEVEQ